MSEVGRPPPVSMVRLAAICYLLKSEAPSKSLALESLPRSNILCVALVNLILPSSLETNPVPYIAVTTADRRLHLVDSRSPNFSAVQTFSSFQDSPILDLVVIECRYLLLASMSGRLLLYDTKTEKVLDQRKDHRKYVVKLAKWSVNSTTIIGTIGWDAKVFVYRFRTDGFDIPQLGDPIATMTTSSIPESLLFVQPANRAFPVLVLTRRDSTFLYYYVLSSIGADKSDIVPLGKQNLAPQSNAWVAFTPADIQICPVDASIVAVATSSTPHMKLQIVRLLIPPEETADADRNQQEPVTHASQTRTDRLLQDKEEAAIIVNTSTMAPQTAYSTPRLVWRPDGSGVYVSSDDGVVRGFEASTGKLSATLEAHEPGSKIRCLWAGRLQVKSRHGRDSPDEEEVLLSGGFDQRVVLWKTA